MQDLRLVGVHDDGEHLLLSGSVGEIYRLRIDEALRVAVSRVPNRPSVAASRDALQLSPREIQARIRSGVTAEHIAEESGLDLARIRRYEGPVQAERDYIAQQARRVEISGALPNHDGYRSAFGDNPATLGDMVAHRLSTFGVDPASANWDAWRRPDGSWAVSVRFEAGEQAIASIGEDPEAKWTFNAARKTVQNGNRWAQLLSELEPLDGPLPARRLTAVADRVFDFEAVGTQFDDAQANDSGSGSEPDSDAAPVEGSETDSEAEELLDVLRSRRGQRLGVDEDGDDALAMLLAQGSIPAAHPRDGGGLDMADPDGSGRNISAQGGAGSTAPDRDGPDAGIRTGITGLSLAPDPSETTGIGRTGLPHLHDGVSTNTTEITISGAPCDRAAEPGDDAERDNAAQDNPVQDDGGLIRDHQVPQDTVPGQDGESREPGTTGNGPKAATGTRSGTGAGTVDAHNDAAGGARRHGTRSTSSRAGQETGSSARKQIKPKRSSMPSWDEIVFGTKGD